MSLWVYAIESILESGRCYAGSGRSRLWIRGGSGCSVGTDSPVVGGVGGGITSRFESAVRETDG